MKDPESSYQWERDGDPVASVIEDTAKVSDDVAQDVQAVLYERHDDFDAAVAGEENPFDEEAHYTDKSVRDYELQASWSYLEHSLKTETRLFNRVAEATLRPAPLEYPYFRH